ncbi:MAG: hypothetical protein IMF12_10985, partial [Proteobacteria bacterium]|nr:hypothetical protein [Pseudomonadota bacterium]
MKKIYLFLLLTTLMTSYSSSADDLTHEQWQFKQALDSFNDKETFQQLSNKLRNYPLYYYLRYKELNSNLKHVSTSEIQTFLSRYENSYFGKKLQKKWLFLLAKQGEWNNFLRFYTPNKSVKLQCYNLHAQIVTGKKVDIKIAKMLWLVDHSQPKSCDFVFDYLYQNSLVSEAMIWERIELLAKKNRFKLINSIAKRLNSKTWVQLWNKMHKNPNRTLANFAEPDLSITRKIILHGIRKLAKKQFTKAHKHWKLLQTKYAFSATQIGELQRDLAIASSKQDPMAMTFLTAINK